VAVSRHEAADHSWRVGDTVTVSFSSERRETVRIAAIYERRDAVPDLLLPMATARQQFHDDLDSQLVIKLHDGVTATAGRQAIEAVTGRYANLQLMDVAGYKAQLEQSVNQLLSLLYALLFLSVVIALIGIANTPWPCPSTNGSASSVSCAPSA
jgi:putative ABC transport system permease protein